MTDRQVCGPPLPRPPLAPGPWPAETLDLVSFLQGRLRLQLSSAHGPRAARGLYRALALLRYLEPLKRN